MAKGACFLFLGPEIGEKQEAVKALRDDITKRQGPPEETSFYAGETPVSAMVSILQNPSLFADARLIFIKNADAIKKKDEVELLSSYIKKPQEDTTLVLISEETKADGALERALPAQGKRIFWELFEDRKIEWVRSFFRKEGYKISEEGIETILELVENNTGALRQECSRLMLFLGKDKPAGPEDVEKWLSHTRGESGFSLFSRIAGGDFTKSLETLHTLLGAKEPIVLILSNLVSCFKKLRDYLVLTEQGPADEFEFKKIGLGSKTIRKNYVEAARRYNHSMADRCLALIAEFEVRLRSSGGAPESLLLDLLVYKLMALPAG